MNKEARKYLSDIGRKGGQVSRRKINPTQQKALQEARKKKMNTKSHK